MRIGFVRKIDRYLGPTACRLLLLVKWFLPSNAVSKKEWTVGGFRNILVIKFFGMGTILLASPAFRALRAKYPSARITMLTLARNREMCELLPFVDEVICLELHSVLGFIMIFARTMFGFRKRKFDVVIDMEFMTCFSALVTLLVTLINRPQVTVGFNSPMKWRNNTHKMGVSFDHSRHVTGIFSKVVESLGVESYSTSYELEKATFLKRMDIEYGESLIKSNNALAKADYLISININAGDLCLHRKWPKEYFAVVVNELIKRANISIVLVGGKQDVPYVSEFKNLVEPTPRVIDTSGHTNVKKLAAILAMSDLFITNDSGPLHLAYILGIKTISFFGPETPSLYGPLENDKHHVFYSDLYCSPCLNIYNSKITYCNDNVCLKSINPESVLQIIKDKYLCEGHN